MMTMQRAPASVHLAKTTTSAAAAADRHARQHHFLSTPAARTSPLPPLTEGRRVGRRATTGSPLIESAARYAGVECQQSDAQPLKQQACDQPGAASARSQQPLVNHTLAYIHYKGMANY